jgi:LPS export ABC transporter protein LptC
MTYHQPARMPARSRLRMLLKNVLLLFFVAVIIIVAWKLNTDYGSTTTVTPTHTGSHPERDGAPASSGLTGHAGTGGNEERSVTAGVSQASGVHLTQYDGTLLRWQLRAPGVVQQGAGEIGEIGEIIARQPELTLYPDQAETDPGDRNRFAGTGIMVSACRAILDQRTRQLVFEDQVVAYDETGRMMFTSRIVFDADRQVLHTDRPVVLEYGRGQLTGTGLEVDHQARIVRVLQNVRVVVQHGWKDLL